MCVFRDVRNVNFSKNIPQVNNASECFLKDKSIINLFLVNVPILHHLKAFSEDINIIPLILKPESRECTFELKMLHINCTRFFIFLGIYGW